jgi:hypothetical protein
MRARHKYEWTERRDKRLMTMASNGCFPGEIAEALGVSVDVVSRRAEKVGVAMLGSRRRTPPRAIEQITQGGVS